jgi:hypothetical protein
MRKVKASNVETQEQIMSRLHRDNAALRNDVLILRQLIDHYKIAINGLSLIVANSHPTYRAEHNPFWGNQS